MCQEQSRTVFDSVPDTFSFFTFSFFSFFNGPRSYRDPQFEAHLPENRRIAGGFRLVDDQRLHSRQYSVLPAHARYHAAILIFNSTPGCTK
jgi:hypothetical protein